MAEHKVQIRIGSFVYKREVPNPRDPDGDPILKNHVARRGDKITVNEADYQKGKRLEAFGDPAADQPEGEASTEAFNPAEHSDDDIADYLREEKPNAKKTVALAGGDPDNAQRLLDVEEAVAEANESEPRTTVVEGLRKIIDKDAD